MFDNTAKPWLIETNLSSSLACSSPLDLKVKGDLMRDTLNLIGMVANESRE